MVEGNGLENRRAGNRTEGSNPSLSAKKKRQEHLSFFLWSLDRKIKRLCRRLHYQ